MRLVSPLLLIAQRSIRFSCRAALFAGLTLVGLVLLLPAAVLIAAGYFVVALAQSLWSLLMFLIGHKLPPPSDDGDMSWARELIKYEPVAHQIRP